MKKISVTVLLSFFAMIFISPSAYPWGSATHAYIAGLIGKTDALANDNEIYGLIAPDIFNYAFGSPYQDYLHDRTHDDFMRIWKKARKKPKWEMEEALAFGFVAHNDVWGSDYIAHWNSLTVPPLVPMPEELQPGYVVIKSVELEALLDSFGVWALLGIAGPEYFEMRIDLCHELVEVAGDYFVRMYMDLAIGQKILAAMPNRSSTFPKLMARAYAGNLVAFSNRMGIPMNQRGALEVLNSSEVVFQGMMTLYAGALSLPDAEVKPAIAQFLASLASVYGITVDPATAEMALDGALFVIADTFPTEVGAVIGYLPAQMDAHKVMYK